MARHKGWRYPNLTLLVVSIAFAVWLHQSGLLDYLVAFMGDLGFIGVFLAGALFISTFTVATGAAILLVFAETMSPILVALLGGAGGVVGDVITMKFIREKLLEELNPILKALHLYRRVNILRSKYFVWLAPVIGAIIIASPFPDEAGLMLLGASRMSNIRLMLTVFVLNCAGIFLMVSLTR